MSASAAAAVAAGGALLARSTRGGAADEGVAYGDRMMWRMPPLSELPAPVITGARRAGLIALRCYLAVAMIMVIVKVILMAVAH